MTGAFDGVGVRAWSVAGRAAAVAACLSLGACAQVGDVGIAGLFSSTAKVDKEAEAVPGQAAATELEKATAYWGKEVEKNPRDGKAALSYARNLKAMGRKQEALAVLQAGYLFNAENREFMSEYGRLALDLGQVNTAAQLLERADDPAKPDWRVVSARGTVLAKQGNYKESIPFFERARELAPGQGSVLNNLAMAYTMDGQADRAEDLLRQASKMDNPDPRVKQNLAMVLSLQGKASEAREVADGGGAAKPVDQVASAPAQATTAPVAPAASAPLDADEIIRQAMQAEAEKSQPAGTAAKPAKKRTTVAQRDDEVPRLKPSSR